MVLSLYSDSFIWMNNHRVLIYNCSRGTYYETLLNTTVFAICHHLLDNANLYSIVVDESNFEEISFAKNIEAKSLGYLHDEDNVIILPPVLKIQNSIQGSSLDVVSYKWYGNLRSISVYLGGGFDGNDLLYCQSDYPINSRDVMDNQTIYKILKNYLIYGVDEIKIIVSDSNNIDGLWRMIKTIDKECGKKVVFCFRMNDMHRNTILRLSSTTRGRFIMIGYPEEYRVNSINWDIIGRIESQFLVGSKKQYKMAEELLKTIRGHASILPIFNGSNISFVRNTLRVSKEMLLREKRNKRMVFAHRVINTECYGRLFIYPDGRIYTNHFSSSIGDINQEPDLVMNKAFSPNSQWFTIRSGKCDNCLYRDLCPSPSVIERLINNECILI